MTTTPRGPGETSPPTTSEKATVPGQPGPVAVFRAPGADPNGSASILDADDATLSPFLGLVTPAKDEAAPAEPVAEQRPPEPVAAPVVEQGPVHRPIERTQVRPPTGTTRVPTAADRAASGEHPRPEQRGGRPTAPGIQQALGGRREPYGMQAAAPAGVQPGSPSGGQPTGSVTPSGAQPDHRVQAGLGAPATGQHDRPVAPTGVQPGAGGPGPDIRRVADGAPSDSRRPVQQQPQHGQPGQQGPAQPQAPQLGMPPAEATRSAAPDQQRHDPQLPGALPSGRPASAAARRAHDDELSQHVDELFNAAVEAVPPPPVHQLPVTERATGRAVPAERSQLPQGPRDNQGPRGTQGPRDNRPTEDIRLGREHRNLGTAPSTKPDPSPRRVPKRQVQPIRDGVPRRQLPRFTDRDPSSDLAITEVAGHLTFTPNTITAWYWLPEVRWAFRPDAEREALIVAISEQYAGLAGFRLHLRRTTMPFPADEWARTVDTHTPRPLPTVPGAPSWGDHLVNAQKHLLQVNHAEGQTYLGITFARRTLGDSFSEKINRMFGKGVTESERRRTSRLVEQFDEVLGAFGMRGRRVTVKELEWLLYRSVALCMAPPRDMSPVGTGEWERGDLLALTEHIERYRTPYGATVKLVNRLTGEERHVCVLTVGRMEPLDIPERHEPWLHFHERLPWPMELSSRVDALGQNDTFKNLEHRLRMIRSQQRDYAEHGMDSPPELERLAKRALGIGDEMTTGLPIDAARVHGWHRIAIGGRTRDEALERTRKLIQMYSRELRISLQHPKNQDWLAREFIPGEPIANSGYVRRMPVKLFAAALPQAASTVGDRRGDLIGRTAGTCRRPVFLDVHFPTEVRERSGLAVFVAEPGGGKSTLMGGLGYLAARRGVQVTMLDPSGPLGRLCEMPELKPYSRVLNLTGSGQGTLNPYALIPTPQRPHFPPGTEGDREFQIALGNARAERRMLVQDICSMLVPPQVAREARTATMLRHAVRKVPAEETATLDDIVKALQDGDDHSRELGNLLLDTAEMPLALLFFGRPPEGALGDDKTLTVITMAGLRLPDLKIEREYWSAEEQLALPMLHTAHRLAVRRCYSGDMHRRKLVGLDEAHFMDGWRSGRSFLVRLARDSRKWNLAALVASQNPKDILGLDVQNLVSTVFVGRIAEDSEIAEEALRLLRVPRGVGYEQTLATLSQVEASSQDRLGFREFVMRDVDGRVQKVRVDISYVPQLLDYLDTTPTAAPEAPPTRGRE
ncbi:ATP-binding protein [Longispora sp. NPDC051575]|uniref:ATP-binding protein n=1 Tax=Longispora sp. NPDC051575 TaxID=3154943 RepID=UPI0034121555